MTLTCEITEVLSQQETFRYYSAVDTHQQDSGVLNAPANSISGPKFSVFTADSHPDAAFQQTAKRYSFKFLLFACQDPPSLYDI